MSVKDEKLKVILYESFDKAKLVWEEFENEGDCYAFQSFNWLKTWYETVGVQAHIKVSIVVVEYPVGEPLMLLPLGIKRHGFVSGLIWLGGKVSDYHSPLLSQDYSKKFTKLQFNCLWLDIQLALPFFDFIFFEKIPEFIVDQENPFLFLPCIQNASNAHYSRLTGSFEHFLTSNRSKKSINTERRKQRRLSEQGSINFKIAINDEEIQHFLEEMMIQKSRSYVEMGVPILFNKPGYRAFFKVLTEEHIHSGFVHLSVLSLNDRILATHWGLVYKNRFYHLFPSYEKSELTKYSPGNLLLWNLLEWCFENKIEIYDFTMGDESYKYHWSDMELKVYDYYYAKTTLGQLIITPLKVLRILKRKIKHSSAFWKIFSWIRSRL